MSDSKENPKLPPPDDFSKTTPNINFDEEESDWGSTPQSSTPSDTPADDWGKTVINYNVAAEHDERKSFGEEQHPSPSSPKQPDWGMTQQNVNLNDEFEVEQSGEGENFGATVPYFRLPEVDRDKYQNIPPTATEQAAEDEKSKKGGIPLWFWAAAGIMTVLAFSFLVFLGLWYFLLGDRGFEVEVKGAKPGSRFTVDGVDWGVQDEDEKYVLRGLKAGKKQIQVINPLTVCTPDILQVEGQDGDRKQEAVSCNYKAVVNLDCANTRSVEEREKCADMALDALGNPPDMDALLKALSMLIINFESGKFNIPDARMTILKKAASKIQQLPETAVIEIGGHTDNVGNATSNLKLSDQRAAAVKKALVDFGVRDAALVTKGYGLSEPVADNNTEKGRFDNRRIGYKAISR